MENALRRVPIFTTFTGVSLTIGLAIPCLYYLGMDSSHPRCSTLRWMALATAAVTFLACFGLTWFGRNDSGEAQTCIQFGLRTILVTVTFAAFVLAILTNVDDFTASWLIVTLALVIGIWSVFQESKIRSRAGALLACTYLPMVWVLVFSEPIGRISGLLEFVPASPGFFEAELARYLFDGVKRQQVESIAAGAVSVQLIIGVLLSRHGGMLFLAYTTLILVLSSLSSFGVFVGTRI